MKVLKILPIILCVCLVFTNVYAIKFPGAGQDLTYGQSGSTEVEHVVRGTWATVALVVQILAVAAVVFAGIRYMYAAADQKAEIKKSMAVLVLGAILVFVSIPAIRLVVTATEEITAPGTINGTGNATGQTIVDAIFEIFKGNFGRCNSFTICYTKYCRYSEVDIRK